MIATLSVTRAFSWTLDVTISSLVSVPNAESHLTYVLEGGRDSNGAWQPAISDQLALRRIQAIHEKTSFTLLNEIAATLAVLRRACLANS